MAASDFLTFVDNFQTMHEFVETSSVQQQVRTGAGWLVLLKRQKLAAGYSDLNARFPGYLVESLGGLDLHR